MLENPWAAGQGTRLYPLGRTNNLKNIYIYIPAAEETARYKIEFPSICFLLADDINFPFHGRTGLCPGIRERFGWFLLLHFGPGFPSVASQRSFQEDLELRERFLSCHHDPVSYHNALGSWTTWFGEKRSL